MRKFYFPLILLAAALAMGSCSQLPISTSEPINNNTYTVDYLFDHDGCKVYRFYDKGKHVYFVNCKESFSTISPDSVQSGNINAISITQKE